MNILYIAYSCNPFAGSEDKIGWCVPYESSKTNKVYVITKEEQREPVEKYLQSHPLENIKFYYVDIPNFYKKIFKGFMYRLFRPKGTHMRTNGIIHRNTENLCGSKN